MVTQTLTTQITITDWLLSHRDEMIEAWGAWRDAQALDDEARQLVDEVYNEYIRTLDDLLDVMLPF